MLFTHSTRQGTCRLHLRDLFPSSIRPESFPSVEKSVRPPRCERRRAAVLNERRVNDGSVSSSVKKLLVHLLVLRLDVTTVVIKTGAERR